MIDCSRVIKHIGNSKTFDEARITIIIRSIITCCPNKKRTNGFGKAIWYWELSSWKWNKLEKLEFEQWHHHLKSTQTKYLNLNSAGFRNFLSQKCPQSQTVIVLLLNKLYQCWSRINAIISAGDKWKMLMTDFNHYWQVSYSYP